jgi:D-lactate dehydrogenase
MNIVFFEIEDWEQTFFKKSLKEHQLTFHKEKLTLSNFQLAESAAIISVFINSKIDNELLLKLDKLRAVVTRSTGTDHIDQQSCKERQIQVLSIPTYGVNTVAEHTFALILALSRKLVKAANQTREADFTNNNLRGFDLFGKTLGIIGYGNIGKRVSQIGQAFGMKILVYTRTVDANNNLVKYVDLLTLLQNSDVITLHTPLTPNTKHIINSNNIKLIKKGAILINTARGPLISTEALVQALQLGTLSGAGLDVLEEERSIKEEKEILSSKHFELTSAKTLLLDHVLMDIPSVIITPHNAFNSNEALNEINQKTVENIKKVMNNNSLDAIHKKLEMLAKN